MSTYYMVQNDHHTEKYFQKRCRDLGKKTGTECDLYVSQELKWLPIYLESYCEGCGYVKRSVIKSIYQVFQKPVLAITVLDKNAVMVILCEKKSEIQEFYWGDKTRIEEIGGKPQTEPPLFLRRYGIGEKELNELWVFDQSVCGKDLAENVAKKLGSVLVNETEREDSEHMKKLTFRPLTHRQNVVKTIFFLTVVLFLAYRGWTCCYDLYVLADMNKENDTLAYSKFAFTYGTEDEWLRHGAEKAETSYEYGDRHIWFNDYETYYQAYDKRDDILGTVIEKKTGAEELRISIQFGEEWNLESSELSKRKFELFNTSYTLRRDIEYIDGTVTSAKSIPCDKQMVENACAKLAMSVDNFEKIAAEVYGESYRIQWSEKIHRAGQYTVLLFICPAVWYVGNGVGNRNQRKGKMPGRRQVNEPEK